MKKKMVVDGQEYVLFKVKKSNEGIPGAVQIDNSRQSNPEIHNLVDKQNVADDAAPSPNNVMRSITEQS